MLSTVPHEKEHGAKCSFCSSFQAAEWPGTRPQKVGGWEYCLTFTHDLDCFFETQRVKTKSTTKILFEVLVIFFLAILLFHYV